MKKSIFVLVVIIVAISGITISILVASRTNNQAGQPRILANSNVSSFDYFMSIKRVNEGGDTNGLKCEVSLTSQNSYTIFIRNITTNNYLFVNIPPEGSCELGLFDSKGAEVKKTTTGQRFGFWTEKQIYDWGLTHVYDGRNFFRVGGGSSRQFSSDYSIPQLFQLNAPGEYALHVRTRFIRNTRDDSGALVSHYINPSEVVTKVQVRPEDISPGNPPPISQTNSPPK